MKKAKVLDRLIREKFKNVRNFSMKNNIPYSNGTQSGSRYLA